jgi:sugar phosphate isomerase/epimerase
MLELGHKSAEEYAGMTGVSPAFFISLFTNRFTPEDVSAGLRILARIGYEGFQLEVYHRDTLPLWVQQGASLVRRESAGLNLKASQFVAHFMMEAFSSEETLYSDAGIEEMKSVLEVVGRFEECSIVTVPLGPFAVRQIPTIKDYFRLFDRCVKKIGLLLELVESSSRRMAVEILPSAIVGGIDGFMRLCERLGTETLGLNFDTGHAWASKENLCLVPAKLGKRILGTHLCDNFGNENLSLRPGAGSIDWPWLMPTLRASGYEGALDIEIVCRPEETRDEYAKGRDYIEALLKS